MLRPGGALAALMLLLAAQNVRAGSAGGMVQGYVRVPAPTVPALPADGGGATATIADGAAAAAAVDRAGVDSVAGVDAMAEVSSLAARWRARIAGNPCVYTPALLPRYTDAAAFKDAPPLTSCIDRQLSPAQQRDCLLCLGQTTQRGCLGQRAVVWYGADTESCTWVGRQSSQSLQTGVGGKCEGLATKYAVGINVPSTHSMRLADDTCSVSVEWEAAALGPSYATAFFEAWMSGFDPATGQEFPRGLQNEVLCVLKGGRRKCRMQLVRPRSMSFMVLSRAVWTESQPIIERLGETSEACLDSPAGRCASGSPKFQYTLRVKEERCKRGQRPGVSGVTVGRLPYAEPGVILYPGGGEYAVFRDMFFFLEGVREASWTIKAPTAMFVAVLPQEAVDDACVLSEDETFWTCDYPAVRDRVAPGTLCVSTSCSGHIRKPKGQQLRLVMAYQSRFIVSKVQPGLINPSETPTQQIGVLFKVTP